MMFIDPDLTILFMINTKINDFNDTMFYFAQKILKLAS